jgi:hypothetical protein
MAAKPIKTHVDTVTLWQEYQSASTVTLAKRYNCTPWNISQRLKIAGYTLRKPNNRIKTKKATITKVQLLKQLDQLSSKHEYTLADTKTELLQAIEWYKEV